MTQKILFVDDDVNILRGFERTLRSRFTVVTADSGDKALQILKKDCSFAVIVSDFRMPAMNGVEFLSKTSAEWPDCVRVLLTGEADAKAVAAAVNQGHIFRFLTKPCPAFNLEKTLTEAVKQHDLITAEKVILERTLRGSMEVLTEIVNLLNPVVFSRSNRIYRTAAQILSSINMASKWEFEIAAMLSQIGCITVPLEILDKVSKGQDLSEKELSLYRSHPKMGCRLIEKIPRLELVAQIIASQDQSGTPIPGWQELEKVDRLALGAQVLKVAIEVEDGFFRGVAKAAVLLQLRSNNYHPALVKAVEAMGFAQSGPAKAVQLADLTTGMILDADIIGDNGLLLMAKGQWLSTTLIQCLQRRFEYSGIGDMVHVRTPADQPKVAGI